MFIVVSIRDVFGRPTVYPVCDTAKAFAALAGTKTLGEHALKIIRQLGYSIETQPRAVA